MRTALPGPWPFLIFAIVFGVHALSPRTASGDSRWTVPVALSILEHHDTNLDEYGDMLAHEQYYAVECVEEGTVVELRPGACKGHYYNMYPVAVPVLSVPFIVALRAVAPVLRAMAPAGLIAAHPEFGALLSGDLLRAHAVVEEWIASFFIALAAVVIYAIARRYLSVAWSVGLALILAFATPAWSSGSRAFGQHAPSMFLVALAICLMLRAEEKPAIVSWLGLVVAAAYVLRPTNGLLVIVATVYVFTRHRKMLVRYVLPALPIVLAFVVYNLSVYSGVLTPYFTLNPWSGSNHDLLLRTGAAFAGEVISPSRGVLVFTPVLLFSIWGMYLAWRQRWEWPLSQYLILWVMAHWLIISLYLNTWWGGHSYGPRFFTDLMPVFVFFLIPAIRAWQQASPAARRAQAVAFLALLAMSLVIHARGAISLATQDWSGTPVDVDRDPRRLWDWSDPQFLRGIRSGEHETVNRTR